MEIVKKFALKVFILFSLLLIFVLVRAYEEKPSQKMIGERETYWLFLHRKSNIEYLYRGIPGDRANSNLVKRFDVKSGIPGEKPTPLPKLLGKKYWIITKKESSADNPETAPYFLTLNIPVSDEEPYGPVPYEECNGQCNWVLPGYFGLHGVNGDESRLSNEDQGSSGCIRHKDSDIRYLYNLLDPEKEEIRYYIEDI
jgi:hypothetical protein